MFVSRIAQVSGKAFAKQVARHPIPQAGKTVFLHHCHSGHNAGTKADNTAGSNDDDTGSELHKEPAQRSRVDLFKGPLGPLPAITVHGCRISPKTVFEEGLKAPDSFPLDPANQKLWRKAVEDHAWGVPEHRWRLDQEWLGCNFVGTSKSPDAAKDFTGVNYGRETPTLYDIDAKRLAGAGGPARRCQQDPGGQQSVQARA